MNTRRFKLLIAALFSLCALVSVRAQQPVSAANTISSGLLIQSAVTSNLPTPIYIDCSKQQNMTLQLETAWSVIVTPGGSSTLTNLVFTLCPSADGVGYDTNQTVSITQKDYGAAGAKQTLVTNLNAQGLKGYFIISIANNHATGVATNTIKQHIKIGAP
jgi:hypothetical protein